MEKYKWTYEYPKYKKYVDSKDDRKGRTKAHTCKKLIKKRSKSDTTRRVNIEGLCIKKNNRMMGSEIMGKNGGQIKVRVERWLDR